MRKKLIFAIIGVFLAMYYFHREGVYFYLPIAEGANYDRVVLEEKIKAALLDLRDLKDRSEGLEIMRHEVAGHHIATSNFGRDEIVIHPEGVVKKPKPKLLTEMGVVPDSYVLIAETAGIFGVVFEPTEDGLLIPTMIVPKTEDNYDPPGLVGQQTYRDGWFFSGVSAELKIGIPEVNVAEDIFPPKYIPKIEQLKRVDQGWLAYYGDATQNDYGNYDEFFNEIITEHIDPGPPDPDICGYTWSPPYLGPDVSYSYTTANGFGEAPGTGDRMRSSELFFLLVSGINTISYCYPYEFSQKRITQRGYDIENGCYRKSDETKSFFPNTFSIVGIDEYTPARHWGILWTVASPQTTDSNESAFPHTQYNPSTVYSSDIKSSFARFFIYTDGVYVADAWEEFFIQGLRRWSSVFETTTGFAGKLREEVTDGDPFYISDEIGITEERAELMKGNEGSLAWVDGSYNGLVKEIAPAEVVVNCGGIEFVIFNEPSGYTRETIRMKDLGIFAKPNTGFDGEIIDAESIDPVYAYSAEILEYKPTESRIHHTSGVKRIKFGLSFDHKSDPKNYLSEELECDDGVASVKVGDNTYELTGDVRAGAKFNLLEH